MPRRPNLLNVKEHLKLEDEIITMLLEDSDSGKFQWKLPPIYDQALRELRFFGRAILRKHGEKKTRKDVYVERLPK